MLNGLETVPFQKVIVCGMFAELLMTVLQAGFSSLYFNFEHHYI